MGPFSLRQVAAALGVVVVAAVTLTIATAPLGSTTPGLPDPAASAYLLRSPIPGLRIGDLAPELEGPTGDGATFLLTDLDTNVISLEDLRGRGVWLNFWASWCPPCQSETPILREMDEQYRDRGLTIVGIQVQQTIEDGRRYADTYELDYLIGADVSAAVFRTYRVFALPTQFFIDPDGRIRAIVNGPLSREDAERLIEAILPIGATGAPTDSPAPTQSPSPSR
ncbi:MAG TPA: TlpA disulfide reductase family protein [Candidatus Limnocylindrales bacterium]|nr:TlpA disulfide reductase family protein [Candidatus Limnocylindrales bacterium]